MEIDMTQAEKQVFMTTAPVEKLVCRMAVPTIISMLITNFYNMADTFFVGKLEDVQSTGAVGITFSMMAIIQALGFMFGHGSGISISNFLGKKENERAERVATTGFLCAFVSGVLLTIFGLLFLEPLCYLLGSTETILPYAKSYLRIILIGAPIMMSSIVINNQMRYQGNATYAMVGIVAGAVINIGLDPLLIFVFDMKIVGAATATVISQFISFLLLYCGSRREGNIHLNIRKVDLCPKTIFGIVKIGFPSLCRQGLASIAAASMNLAAGPFGDEIIAGMTVSNRIMMFINATMIGFGQGFQPVCGFNYGAGKFDRVKKAFLFCVKASFVGLLILAGLAAGFAPTLIRCFKNDPKVIEMGVLALRLHCLSLPLNSVIVMTNMLLQASGKSLSATIAAAARQGLFYLPIIWIIPRFFGIYGIAAAQPLADVLALLLAIPFAVLFFRNRQFREQQNV